MVSESEEELKKTFDEYERKRRDDAREFDPRMFDAQAIMEEYIPELNVKIRFGQLTVRDLLDVQKQPPEEQPYYIAYHMLRKAYPYISIEDLKGMDAAAFTLVMNTLYKKSNLSKLSTSLQPTSR
ncbi:MAG: hypothetical protein QW334_00260 [Thermofilum sp.]